MPLTPFRYLKNFSSYSQKHFQNLAFYFFRKLWRSDYDLQSDETLWSNTPFQALTTHVVQKSIFGFHHAFGVAQKNSKFSKSNFFDFLNLLYIFLRSEGYNVILQIFAYTYAPNFKFVAVFYEILENGGHFWKRILDTYFFEMWYFYCLLLILRSKRIYTSDHSPIE